MVWEVYHQCSLPVYRKLFLVVFFLALPEFQILLQILHLLIFLVCAKANGISTFKKIEELRQKETDRLKFGNNFLNKIGIKTKLTHDSIKIYGNPNLKLNKTYKINKFDKDHRACMTSIVAALTLGGKWKINDIDSINTSFPNFIKILKTLGAKIN